MTLPVKLVLAVSKAVTLDQQLTFLSHIKIVLLGVIDQYTILVATSRLTFRSLSSWLMSYFPEGEINTCLMYHPALTSFHLFSPFSISGLIFFFIGIIYRGLINLSV